MRVGIAGCGAIGGFLAGELEEALLFDKNPERAEELAEGSGGGAVDSLEELAEKSDLVVEAAAPAAVREIGSAALSTGADFMAMSVAGLLDPETRGELEELAEENDAEIHTPSGAICGLDGVKSAAVREIDSARLTTRKPPEALEGAPGVEGVDLDGIEGEEEVFSGSAERATELFPKNVNVSASLSLAGIGPCETEVRIVADPSLERNVHEVEVEGEFGRLETRTENVPSPENPKTSYLAALSALATVRRVEARLKLGT